MKIVFVRSAPLNLTPAIERYVGYLRGAGFGGEIAGLELDFQPDRPPVTFVSDLDSFRASYQTRLQRIAMMARWQLYQLRRLWRHRPDVVQICDVFSAAPALVVKWLRGARLVYDVRDPASMTLSHWGGLVSGALGRLEEFALRRSDVVVMVSEPLKARLDAATQARTVVIPNAPMEDRFPGLRFSEDGKLRVSLAGFISHRRNLEAWCQVAGAGEEVLLDLFGIVYDDETRAMLARHGHPEPKGLTHAEAMERMAEADVVSIMYDPSIELNRYVAPNKFFDALMLGKPVICSEGMLLAGELAEAGCGLAVPYGDASALSNAIETLRDPAARRRMGEASRRRWTEVYLGMPLRARAEVYRRAGVLAG